MVIRVTCISNIILIVFHAVIKFQFNSYLNLYINVQVNGMEVSIHQNLCPPTEALILLEECSMAWEIILHTQSE